MDNDQPWKRANSACRPGILRSGRSRLVPSSSRFSRRIAEPGRPAQRLTSAGGRSRISGITGSSLPEKRRRSLAVDVLRSVHGSRFGRYRLPPKSPSAARDISVSRSSPKARYKRRRSQHRAPISVASTEGSEQRSFIACRQYEMLVFAVEGVGRRWRSAPPGEDVKRSKAYDRDRPCLS